MAMMGGVGLISFMAILLLESKIITRLKSLIFKPKEFAEDTIDPQGYFWNSFQSIPVSMFHFLFSFKHAQRRWR